MAQKDFRCKSCGYIPRDIPRSGRWFCPKCGKSATIATQRPRVPKKFHRTPTRIRKTQDQIATQIYDKLAASKLTDLGFKEPYLNPKISHIIPQKREKIRLFYKK